ncbi:MAG: TRAM domain-containing protein [Nanoarchaeota archaeon]
MYNKNRRFGESRGGYGDGERSFAPVKVGDEIDLKIEAVGEKGDGIAKIKGFVIFVPNAKQGEEVKVRITKVLRKVGFGEVVGAGSIPKEESESTNPEEEKSYEEPKTDEEVVTEEDSEDFGDEV